MYFAVASAVAKMQFLEGTEVLDFVKKIWWVRTMEDNSDSFILPISLW